MVINARYAGTCRTCGRSFPAGTQIEWERGAGASHSKCPGSTSTELSENEYRVGGGEGYGCRGFEAGQTLQNSPQKIESGEPEFLTVTSASKRYYREDGMSFGVGDESGYAYWGRARKATDEESAPLREAIAKRETCKKARRELKAVCDEISAAENYHETQESISLQGEEIAIDDSGSRIYGGGEWFVIEPEASELRSIWFVRNNGMDGDNWGHNNIRTGGAGGIGYRVDWTPELELQIRILAMEVAAS